MNVLRLCHLRQVDTTVSTPTKATRASPPPDAANSPFTGSGSSISADDTSSPLLDSEALKTLAGWPELDYLSHVVFRMFEACRDCPRCLVCGLAAAGSRLTLCAIPPRHRSRRASTYRPSAALTTTPCKYDAPHSAWLVLDGEEGSMTFAVCCAWVALAAQR
eukprot:scaffold5321_cov366-Prasinococcus_capsulatus_cf.AAC.13